MQVKMYCRKVDEIILSRPAESVSGGQDAKIGKEGAILTETLDFKVRLNQLHETGHIGIIFLRALQVLVVEATLEAGQVLGAEDLFQLGARIKL